MSVPYDYVPFMLFGKALNVFIMMIIFMDILGKEVAPTSVKLFGKLSRILRHYSVPSRKWKPSEIFNFPAPFTLSD